MYIMIWWYYRMHWGKFNFHQLTQLQGSTLRLQATIGEGSDTRRNLIHFWVKSLEIFAEIRKSYSKSQSEILKLANFPYFNSVNFYFLFSWGWGQPMGVAQPTWPRPDIKRERSCSVVYDLWVKELIVDFYYVFCETGVVLHMHWCCSLVVVAS